MRLKSRVKGAESKCEGCSADATAMRQQAFKQEDVRQHKGRWAYRLVWSWRGDQGFEFRRLKVPLLQLPNCISE